MVNLDNKRIAIVGSALSIKGKKLGKEIDSYDLVVRVNRYNSSKKKLHKDIGMKSDILYVTPHWKKIDIKDLYNCGIQLIVSSYDILHKPTQVLFHKIKNYNNIINGVRRRSQNNNIIKFDYVPNKYRKEINSNIKFGSYTGMIAICHLLSLPILELKIFAMDFYDNHKFGKRELRLHDAQSQFEYFCNVILKDKRVKCDEVLMNKVNR